MKARHLPSLFAFILFSLALTIAAAAQGTTSRVTGIVVDPAGAAVENATVTLRNEATSVTITTQTTSAGAYVFDSVQVGTYTLTVECADAAGNKTTKTLEIAVPHDQR